MSTPLWTTLSACRRTSLRRLEEQCDALMVSTASWWGWGWIFLGLMSVLCSCKAWIHSSGARPDSPLAKAFTREREREREIEWELEKETDRGKKGKISVTGQLIQELYGTFSREVFRHSVCVSDINVLESLQQPHIKAHANTHRANKQLWEYDSCVALG